MKKFEQNNVKLYLQDAIEGMKSLEENSYDICIIDPPYGVSTKNAWNYDSSKKTKGFGGKWGITNEVWDTLSGSEILNSTFAWLSEVKRIIKPSGSIFIHSTYHNSGFVNVCCQILGLEIINEIVWYKRNSFPNLSGRRLTASHETILWVHTGGKKREYQFNYEESKRVSYKHDNLKLPGKQMRTVWDIPNNKKKIELKFGKHPTQKPLNVPDRILSIVGGEDLSLLVPFVGSGTEIVAGIKHKMNVTGFETEEEYFNLARKRILNEYSEIEQTLF